MFLSSLVVRCRDPDMSLAAVWCSILIIFAAGADLAGGQTSMVGLTYCTETSPLDTKYFVPFYESHVPVNGCAARERSTTPPGYQVHVIRINTTSKEVMLHFNENDVGAKGLILVLDSSTAVRWRLSFLGETPQAYKRVLFLSQNSSVHSSNAHISSYGNLEQLKVTRSTPDPQLANIAAINWGGLTTFSRIEGANRISISMPKAESLPSTCLIGDPKSSLSLSNSVLAYLVTKQTMSGCFHPEVAGQSSSDVHVIDLISADPEAQSFRVPESQEDEEQSNLPAVYLSLSPDQKGSSIDESVSRNLTLILKSQFPVRWYLESWGLAGNLEVVSNNGPVENYSLSSWQHLHIVRRTLPEAFEQLWKSVIADTGATPVSYIKVELANVLSMVIPPRSKRGLSDVYSSNKMSSAQLVPDDTNLFNGETEFSNKSASKEAPAKTLKDKSSRELEDILGSYLVKKCTDNQMIIVTLPISITDRFNVSEIRFQEPHCKGTKNETHWVLKTQSTSCGSISYFTDSNPVVRNSVVVKFAAGSEHSGSAVRLPISCRFQAGLFGYPVTDADDDDSEDDLERIGGDDSEYEDNYSTSSDDFKEEVYRMRVFRSSPAPLALLMENPSDTATLAVGDKVRVETEFETRSILSLALEQCWITDGSDLHQGVQVRTNPEDPKWLIWQGCPSNSNVTMASTSTSTNFPTFSFTVTEDHHKLKRVYIVCLIGLCSPGESLGGNIGQCYVPSMCSSSKDNDSHMGPAAQQLSKRGPIFIVDNKDVLESIPTLPPPAAGLGESQSSQNLNSKDVDENSNSSHNNQTPSVLPESPSLHSSHVVMVGVPAEIAVVIALSSFVIGAVLTGLLCCIHHRRSMPKNNFHMRTSCPDDPAEGSELQSMIASPTLQLPQPNGLVST